MPYISVDIPVAGDWPSTEDMDARNAIIDELDALNIGQFSGAGGGMGSVDFDYRVTNADAAVVAIKKTIAKHLPNREYSIHVADE